MRSPLACLFLDEKKGDPVNGNMSMAAGYSRLAAYLRRFDGDHPFKVATRIRPFQLFYRSFDVYLLDVGGVAPYEQAAFMLAAGRIVRGRRSRLFLFWTDASYRPFIATHPDFQDWPNCINCSDRDADEKIKAQLDNMRKLW